ncbi:MAG: radical SAM protein [Clostridia bacterium]|nr:radical SAM protein [Clostridia bacterium]
MKANSKKNIYFVQPNSMLGGSIYFPYAVGVIAAYCFSFPAIKEQYRLGGIVFKEDAPEDVFKHLDNPYFVAFSNYFWNYRYNLDLAQQIKERYPDCRIVFGGHQIPKNTSWLEQYDFIDFLVFDEGEIPVYELLKCRFEGESLADIPNIAYRCGSSIQKTAATFVGVKEYPSPYTNGIFDKLLNVDDSLEFNAQLETNRGCPYHCSFCDWCSYGVPMRLFEMEKIKKDLEWMAAHKIVYCMCVDSNFGLYERDEEIAAYIVSLKEKCGYPQRFGACFAKNKTMRIFRINKVLNDAGMSKGVSLAFQSMSDEVLKNVSRTNMNREELFEQLTLYHENNIPTYTELILGLPGETYESFCKGMCELLELGQHDSINVFRCEVYPNSDLADKDYMKRFGIKTAINKMNLNHCDIQSAVFAGGLEYIIETSTMTREQLAQANLFSACIQGVHCHGLLQFIALYLHNECGVKYYDFYTNWIAYFMQREQTLIGSVLHKICRSIRAVERSEVDFSYINREFGEITWPYEESVFLDFVNELDRFYEEVAAFLAQYHVDETLLGELISYQSNRIAMPGENDVREHYHFNFYEYFKAAFENAPVALKQQVETIRFYSAFNYKNKPDYARNIVWYGRRNKRTLRDANPCDE